MISRTFQQLGGRQGPGAERGAVAVMAAGALLVMLTMCGLAVDLARMYNRKMELQNVADGAVLAAARKLDGTAAGIDAAVAAAAAYVGANGHYGYYQKGVVWSDAAIQFAAGASGGSGGWADVAAARAAPAALLFARVDTRRLAPEHASVAMVFMASLFPGDAQAAVQASAVAGRRSLDVTPLAVCANSPTPAVARGGELVEYGFRRGVSYDLMQLNPHGTMPAHFLVNPIAPPGTVGAAVAGNWHLIAPYICTGTMAVARLKGGAVTVERGFPLAGLFEQLNSRFGTYASPCQSSTAPPDINVKSYQAGAGASWMVDVPDGQTAQATTAGGVLQTVADPEPGLPGTTARMYGPLWAYARAAQFAAFVPGQAEPAGGYASFSPAAWGSLYLPGAPKANASYPTAAGATPYRMNSGSFFLAPPGGLRGVRDRRVLNVPLLACPVVAGSKASAVVLAVGRFFMTVPATSTSLPVEFAGLAPDAALGGAVELFR